MMGNSLSSLHIDMISMVYDDCVVGSSIAEHGNYILNKNAKSEVHPNNRKTDRDTLYILH